MEQINFKTELKNIILNANCLKQTKDKLINDIDKQKEINEDIFNRVLSNIKKVILANDQFFKMFNKIEKQAIKLERHNFAPEMNILHLKNNIQIKVPGYNELKEAIKKATFLELNKLQLRN